MKYQAIMFDLDGTLADTLADIAAAANHALSEMGRPIHDVRRYRYLAGQGLEPLMVEALGPEHQHLVSRGAELFKAYYLEHSLDFTRPYDGVPELLDELHARKLTLAVLSNKPHVAAVQLVKDVFGRWTFDIVQGHQPPAALKPDPASAIAVAQKLDIAPEQWLYVGDTRVDMLTGSGAGFFPVGVLWGFRDESELRESGARAIIKHPMELLKLL
jgi:phosphoglycolate phosphatase